MKISTSPHPTRRRLFGIGLAAAAIALVALGTASFGWRGKGSEPGTVVVYKSATCNCCSKWVEHLRQAGLKVEVHNENAMNPLKAKLGVPPDLASCHTALVNGYVIEGHVPASDIQRLLTERPQAKGLAVPGMPIGSPGMEQGDRIDPYEVLLFSDTGKPQVFAVHGRAESAP